MPHHSDDEVLILCFHGGYLTAMIIAFTLIASLGLVGALVLVVLAAVEGAIGLGLVAMGLVVLSWLARDSLRRYRRARGLRLRVDSRGIGLPDVDVLLPWGGLAAARFLRHRRWWTCVLEADPDRTDLRAAFKTFNGCVPSSLGPLAGRSAGLVLDMLEDPARNRARLVAAIRHHAPHLLQGDFVAAVATRSS